MFIAGRWKFSSTTSSEILSEIGSSLPTFSAGLEMKRLDDCRNWRFVDTAGDAAARPADAPSLSALGLSALGVVFGDIGTSPLYTLKTVLGLPAANSRRWRLRSACSRS